MEIKRITKTDDELYKKAMTLYGMSFPLHASSAKRILRSGYWSRTRTTDIEPKITE